MHSKVSVLQSLLKGSVLGETTKVSLLESLNSCCAQNSNQPNDKAGLGQQFEIADNIGECCPIHTNGTQWNGLVVS